jgi:hypothetical protein
MVKKNMKFEAILDSRIRDYHGWIQMDPDKYPWMVDKFLWIWIYPWIIHIIHKTDK